MPSLILLKTVSRGGEDRQNRRIFSLLSVLSGNSLKITDKADKFSKICLSCLFFSVKTGQNQHFRTDLQTKFVFYLYFVCFARFSSDDGFRQPCIRPYSLSSCLRVKERYLKLRGTTALTENLHQFCMCFLGNHCRRNASSFSPRPSAT